MANRPLSIGAICNEALRLVDKGLGPDGKRVLCDEMEAKLGFAVNIRKVTPSPMPLDFTPSGWNVTEACETVVLDRQPRVCFQDLGLLALSMDAMSQRIEPYAISLSREIDRSWSGDTLVCGCLGLPQGVDIAARGSDPDIGLSLRCIRMYQIETDSFTIRFDILFGSNGRFEMPPFMSPLLDLYTAERNRLAKLLAEFTSRP